MFLTSTGSFSFLSTPSARRATCFRFWSHPDGFISIHALREEGDLRLRQSPGVVVISIHALREEGDLCPRPCIVFAHISIHALREEGDPIGDGDFRVVSLFLSTPSARRATTHRHHLSKLMQKFLSTPSARRATPAPHAAAGCCRYFYPRPPRGGRLRQGCCLTHIPSDFYPRPPRGGRPGRLLRYSDRSDFYPRPPRGGRRPSEFVLDCVYLFLSTPSARRATAGRGVVEGPQPISIHALREEGDGSSSTGGTTSNEFLSTPSARRATDYASKVKHAQRISIHALREEGD